MAIKVSQDVINEIKRRGMKASMEAANSGKESAEFVEGARRFYGTKPGRTNPTNEANTRKRSQETRISGRAVESVGDRSSSRGNTPRGGRDPDSQVRKTKPVPMPESAPAAATRKSGRAAPYDPKKGEPLPASKTLKKVTGWFTSGNAKAKKEEEARRARNPSKPKPVKTRAQIDAEKRTKERVKKSSYDPQSARMRGR
jgi:hypothetical protein